MAQQLPFFDSTPVQETDTLLHQLDLLRRRRLPPLMSPPVLRLGIAAPEGRLLHAYETTRLTEAVRALALVKEAGWVACHDIHQDGMGRRFTRVFRPR